ncbi:MAG: UbiA family prenyltransferase [Anaerolineales bacterium]|nr:UbiA family prenyltransferase [Anaerolineales bacterium]
MKRPSFFTLFLNHADAWQVALTIATLVLLIHQRVTFNTMLLLVAVGLGYWLGFAVNDFFDAPIDAQNAQKAMRNFFVGSTIRSETVRLVFGLASLGLFVVFALFGLVGLLFLLLAYLAMWAYSAPPLRLKNRPGYDLLMHVLFVQTFPYVMTLTLIQGKWTGLDAAIVLLLLLASLTAQLEQQARDFEVDQQDGRNFTTLLGYKTAVYVVRGITAVLIGAAFVFVITGVIPWFVLPFGLIGLPALLHRFFRSEETPRSEGLVLFSTTAGLLYTGVIFFYFLLR